MAVTRNWRIEAGHLLSLMWDYRVLTGVLILVCVPLMVPVIVHAFPLLVSTGLCAVVLRNLGSKIDEARQEMEAKLEGGPCTATGAPPHGYGNYEMLEPWYPTSSGETSHYYDCKRDQVEQVLMELSSASGRRTFSCLASATDGDSRPPGTAPDMDGNLLREWSHAQHQVELEENFVAGGPPRGPAAPRPGRKPGTYAGHQRWTDWLNGFEAHPSWELTMDDTTPRGSAIPRGNRWVSGLRAAKWGRNADGLHRKCRSVDEDTNSLSFSRW